MSLFRYAVTVILLGSGIAAEQPVKSIYDAVRNDDLKAIQRLLKNGTDVNVRGDRNMTPLMYAAAFGSTESMRILLGAGADVNSKNDFDATALMWGIGDINKVRLLLEKSAQVNVLSKLKMTPLLLACFRDGSLETVDLLLAHEAVLKMEGQAFEALAAAAMANDTAVVRLLLGKRVDVDVHGPLGVTALMSAASNGNPEMARLLLAKGADVNAVSVKPFIRVKNGLIDLGEFTPLLFATTYGPPELVQMLLKAGAKVNAQDSRGMTPLHFAVSSEAANPAIVKMLLDAGANPSAKTATGETPTDWATKFGNPAITRLLPGAQAAAHQDDAKVAAVPVNTRAATQKSLELLQNVSATFFDKGGCVGCHAQNITATSVAIARSKGLRVNEAAAAQDLKMTSLGWFSQRDALLLRNDPPGGADMLAYSLWAMHAAGHTPDITSDAMLHNLAATQAANGSWHGGGMARVPVEDSDIPRTAIALRMLRVFQNPGLRTDYEQRIRKAGDWLAAAKPVYAEERNWQLMGLKWTGADPALIQRLSRELIALQRSDGGWAQNSYLACDAYATGQALYALHQTGMLAVNDAAYQRGVAWLLRARAEDGSWHVKSRAVKFQPYFQSGFPYDHDQWISQMATGWATMALSFSLEQSVAAR